MRWLALGLALMAGCASVIPAPVPPPTIEYRIWIRGTEPEAAKVCLELFEPNSLMAYRCLPLKDLRTLFDKIGSSD